MERVARVSIACALALLLTPRAEALRVPLLDGSCDLAGGGITNPTSIAMQPGVGFAVADATSDTVTRFDLNCGVLAFFSTSAFGSTQPNGITYDTTSGEYVLVDSSADEVYFASTTGLLNGSCDLAAIGITAPSGIAHDPISNTYAITDTTQDEVFLVDGSVTNGSSCNLVGQFDTTTFGSTSPSDVAYLPGTDEFAVVDSSADEVFLVSKLGVLADQFDTASGFGSTNPTGIVYDFTNDRYHVVDSSADEQLIVDARGTTSFACDTSLFLSNAPHGATINPSTGELAFVDDVTDQVYIINPSTCTLIRQIGLGLVGATDPSGVAYLPLTNELAVSDDSGNEVYFINYSSGLLTSQCDTASRGIDSPSGIDYLPDLDLLVVSTNTEDGWAIMDVGCNPMHVRHAGMLEKSTSGTNPRDIAYFAGGGNFLIADSSADEVYVANFEGVAERHFDTQGLGLTNLSSITANPAVPGEFIVMDDSLDEIHTINIPALLEPVSLSGKFTSASSTVYLFERGDGRVTGSAFIGGSSLPVFGEYIGGAGGLAIGAVTVGGTPVSFGIGVSGDLNTISAPPPVGTLTRTY